MILAVGNHDEEAVGPMPSNIPGWTRVPIDPGPLHYAYARSQVGGTGYAHCDLWYRHVQAGDTGVETGSDCMKILAEFTGILEPIAEARAESSGNNNGHISITSGDPGGPALVIAAIITRQDDTGRVTEAAGTNKMPIGPTAGPPGSDAPAGVGHDALYVLWATTSGAAVTLEGEQTGPTEDPEGYWWGARLAVFEACT